MKVYVMSEEEWRNQTIAASDLSQILMRADAVFAGMTSIGIPDGCQLAVVATDDCPTVMTKVVDDQVTRAYRETSRYELCKLTGYRRVVQVVEVK